jgi:thioester reductase-like protein
VSSLDKPFPLTAKGTVKRQAAANLYEAEINELYKNYDKPSTLEAPRLDVSSQEALTQSILDVFDMRIGSTCLDEEADFYAAGIDSLQMILAARLLRSGIEASGLAFDVELIKPSTIYGNPTPRRLAAYILSSASSAEDGDARVITSMQKLLDKYSQNFAKGTTTAKIPRSGDSQTVVLTGSTGTFGCYLLNDILQDPNVARVICLNRSEGGGRQRQPNLMASRGLNTDLAPKADFYRIDITRPDLGLAPPALEIILESADHIIHAAWAVNFNVSVESMEPQIAGVRHIIDIAARCKKRVNVATTSSAGAFDRWDVATKGPAVPEETLDDLMIASNGYCQSKILGNILLDKGARVGGFDATIARVGQIAGPLGEKGSWNKHELFPSLIESSIELGALPKDVGLLNRVDWLPLEVASRTILDTVIIDEESFDNEGGRGHVRIVHCANPAATTFDQLIPAIQEFFGTDRIPEVIGFREWIEKLEARALDDPVRLPAIKLVDTFRSVLVPEGEKRQPVYLETTKTKERSRALREAGPVTPDMMRHWCSQWKL